MYQAQWNRARRPRVKLRNLAREQTEIDRELPRSVLLCLVVLRNDRRLSHPATEAVNKLKHDMIHNIPNGSGWVSGLPRARIVKTDLPATQL